MDLLNLQSLSDRNSCRIDNMGTFWSLQSDEMLKWVTLEKAAMAYIVRTSMMSTLYNCIDNILEDIRQRFHSLRLWGNLWMPDQRHVCLGRNLSPLHKWSSTRPYHIHGCHLSTLNIPHGCSCQSPSGFSSRSRSECLCEYYYPRSFWSQTLPR